MIRRIVRWAGWLGGALAAAGAPGPLPAQGPLVRAVLFYSPTCPHCHKVIQEDLPGIFARFGGEPRFYQGSVGHVLANRSLALLLVNMTEPAGRALYDRVTERFHIPDERLGVPRLLCKDSILVGDVEIPEVFPSMIAAGLAAGGIAWPAIDGLTTVFPPGYDAGVGPGADSVSRVAPASAPPPSVIGAGQGVVLLRTLKADPIGTSVALALIVAMLGSLIWIGMRAASWEARGSGAAVPLLALAGTAIAAYLTYVETTGVTAVCGPVGDCNAVQHSPYARLLGLVPVAVVGLVWYVGIFAAWAVARAGRGRTGDRAAVMAFLLALTGTAGSVVLTVLEPFVIGAVCAWCLTSAAVMTALLWLLAGSGMAGARALRPGAA